MKLLRLTIMFKEMTADLNIFEDRKVLSPVRQQQCVFQKIFSPVLAQVEPEQIKVWYKHHEM